MCYLLRLNRDLLPCTSATDADPAPASEFGIRELVAPVALILLLTDSFLAVSPFALQTHPSRLLLAELAQVPAADHTHHGSGVRHVEARLRSVWRHAHPWDEVAVRVAVFKQGALLELCHCGLDEEERIHYIHFFCFPNVFFLASYVGMVLLPSHEARAYISHHAGSV